MAAPYGTISYVQNSALIIVIGFYEPYHGISSVLIVNTTVSVARSFAGVPHRQVDTLGGRGLIVHFFLSFFSQASAIMAEAITIIQAQTNWIFSGILHA